MNFPQEKSYLKSILKILKRTESQNLDGFAFLDETRIKHDIYRINSYILRKKRNGAMAT